MENYSAWLDEYNMITVESMTFDPKPLTDPIIKINNSICDVESIFWGNDTLKITLAKCLPLEDSIRLIWGGCERPVYPRGVVRSKLFDEVYDASDVKLGCFYTIEETRFSVWAPTATKMVTVLDNEKKPMTKESNGVWHTTVTGDCHLAHYYFLVTINGHQDKVNDPYARSMTANSEEGVVVDVRKTDLEEFRTVKYPQVAKENAIIYELHVRDATSSQASGVKQQRKFLGLTERASKNQAGYSTGLSYLSQLGCTHVQLLPVQDFARVDELHPEESYNWGYDPLYYFAPEGSYATDANDPLARVYQLKQMIQAFHEENLSVILDVVFNHVFAHQASAFEKLVPGYYFRYDGHGKISNATGTGNDLATERNMVRKLILDCVDYLLSEYQIDGFRFDLMGIIDIQTMQAICKRCEQEQRPILLLGEGWEMDTPLLPKKKSCIAQSDQLPTISFFNDRFRDSMKGNLFDSHDVGFVNGEGHYNERLPGLVAGSCQYRYQEHVFNNPLQSVNYVECHDNHTLWDRLKLTNPNASDQARKQMHQLATGLTLLSQGIPFLHAGQEFFRTKQGDENSYISSDEINQLDWVQRGKEDDNVQWVRKLIQFRKQYRLLRMPSAEEINHRFHSIMTPDPVFGFLLAGEREDLVVYVNPTSHEMQIEKPAPGQWKKLLSNHTIPDTTINHVDPITTISAYELVVYKKDRK